MKHKTPCDGPDCGGCDEFEQFLEVTPQEVQAIKYLILAHAVEDLSDYIQDVTEDRNSEYSWSAEQVLLRNIEAIKLAKGVFDDTQTR